LPADADKNSLLLVWRIEDLALVCQAWIERHLGGVAARREGLYRGYPRSPCVDRKDKPISTGREISQREKDRCHPFGPPLNFKIRPESPSGIPGQHKGRYRKAGPGSPNNRYGAGCIGSEISSSRAGD
jgi:hypothetical protein